MEKSSEIGNLGSSWLIKNKNDQLSLKYLSDIFIDSFTIY